MPGMRDSLDLLRRSSRRKDLLNNFPQAYVPDGCNEGPPLCPPPNVEADRRA
jgi:hypothetical protein